MITKKEKQYQKDMEKVLRVSAEYVKGHLEREKVLTYLIKKAEGTGVKNYERWAYTVMQRDMMKMGDKQMKKVAPLTERHLERLEASAATEREEEKQTEETETQGTEDTSTIETVDVALAELSQEQVEKKFKFYSLCYGMELFVGITVLIGVVLLAVASLMRGTTTGPGYMHSIWLGTSLLYFIKARRLFIWGDKFVGVGSMLCGVVLVLLTCI